MLPYYPARDGYPSMFEADDARSAIGATELAPAICTSTRKCTSGTPDRERLPSAAPRHRHWRSHAKPWIARKESAIPRN